MNMNDKCGCNEGKGEGMIYNFCPKCGSHVEESDSESCVFACESESIFSSGFVTQSYNCLENQLNKTNDDLSKLGRINYELRTEQDKANTRIAELETDKQAAIDGMNYWKRKYTDLSSIPTSEPAEAMELKKLKRERDIAREALAIYAFSGLEGFVKIDGVIWSMSDLRGEWCAETLIPWAYALADAESELEEE